MVDWIKDAALAEVEAARASAYRKHGALKMGADRWMRLISEEYEEVCDELVCLHPVTGNIARTAKEYRDIHKRAISELAQLSQLCIGVIELLQQEKEDERNGKY
jgi:hypothetical protein